MPDADARPLFYIAPGAETHISLDGPTLCVQRGEQAEQLFPVRRLSRIHCTEAVRWSTEALLACARQGIAVLFVDDTGEVVARLLGRPGEVDDLSSRLLDFLLLPQALGRYEHWRLSYEKRVAWWAGARLHVPLVEREPGPCRASIVARAMRYAGEREEVRTRQWLRGIAHGWMQSHLQDLGLGANTELAQVGAPALARDLTGLFMWYLEPARLGWLRRRWIANPKRLVKVHRQVSKRGLPLQYSVFLLLDTPAGLDRLLGQLDRLINGREDDIRVYPLPDRLDAEHYGRQFLPEGVRLFGDEDRDRLGALVGRGPLSRGA